MSKTEGVAFPKSKIWRGCIFEADFDRGLHFENGNFYENIDGTLLIRVEATSQDEFVVIGFNSLQDIFVKKSYNKMSQTTSKARALLSLVKDINDKVYQPQFLNFSI